MPRSSWCWSYGRRDSSGPGSASGGFQIAICRSALGALSWSTRLIWSSPVSAVASSRGFAIVASLALAVYFAGAAVYVPHLFSSYASRYGAIGAVFAMISALFGFMVFLVASAALGREVFEELNRIRAGERPPDDEIRREWDTFIREARSRWQTLRDQIDRIRRKHAPPSGGDGDH